MRIPHDYHMHSNFSYDGKSTPEEMCRRAIELGIPEIGFTEHYDINPLDEHPGFFQPEAWLGEIENVRRRFNGKLIIRTGVEIAEPHLFPEQTAYLLERVPFDFIIGSLHFLGERSLFDKNYFRQTPAGEMFPAYFAELELMTRTPDFDILGHLDIPARTAKIVYGGYDPGPYEDHIRPVLRNVIKHGLALDVNTAGLRKPAKNLMPDPLVLEWYAEMGGERLTIGSDAHNAEQVGLNLNIALEAIRRTGINSIIQFERRQVRFLPLE